MQTHSVQETINEEMSTCDVKSTNTNEVLDFIDKEVDMGFFNQHSFKVKEGVVVNNGCQRINKCSCNCNDCTLLW